MAKQFDEVEALIDAAEGGSETVLVSGRNKQVIKVLREEMAKGKKRLAIFYGAAHLSDLERRVLDLGFDKSGQIWLTAWDIIKPTSKTKTTPTAAKALVPTQP